MDDFPLHRAAEKGELERAWQLLEGGVSVNSRDDDQEQTPLHRAAYWGRYEVAKLLIDRQCDLNPRDRFGRTPLWLAASALRKDVVDLLIERGAQMNYIHDNTKVSLLHCACREGWLDVVRIILEKGEANLNAATYSGETPLMRATVGRHGDVAALLIRAGADVNRSDAHGTTALHLASFFPHRIQVLQVLLEQEGLHLNPQDEHGMTPLHKACLFGCRDGVQLLLQAGADPNIENNHSQTALSEHIRKENASPVEIRLLVQHGAFFEKYAFVLMSRNPLLKENILKDAELCSQSVINKYHRQSLPTLYRNPYFAGKLPNSDNFILNAQQIEEVEKLVKRDIIRNTFCNVVKIRPMALSALCVLPLAALPCQA